MGYGSTEGFALGCRGDGAAAGLPDCMGSNQGFSLCSRGEKRTVVLSL